MSVGHKYMHDGKFPSARIPQLPADFNYWDGGMDEGDDDNGEEDGDGASGGEDGDGASGDALGYGVHHEMDDRELGFYLDMYGT